jgi:hypothetical protein
MLLVILIVLNGAFYARRQNNRMAGLLSAQVSDGGRMNAVKRNLNISFLIQLLLFLAIFVLSVFRF